MRILNIQHLGWSMFRLRPRKWVGTMAYYHKYGRIVHRQYVEIRWLWFVLRIVYGKER